MKKQRGRYHKYTESERVEIKRLYNEGSMSYRGIAKMLGYPESSVKSIILSGIDEPGHGIRYPKAHRAGIMQMEVVEPMPRKVSGEDLKRENRDLREEVEYLKDKVAYLESLYEISMKEKAGSAQKKRGSALSLQQSQGKDGRM